MKRFFLAAAVAASLQYANAATTPAHAGGGDVAAGLVGGLAAGTIIGAAVACTLAFRFANKRAYSTSAR